MAEAEPDNSEPLKYKTWVLKVSIHCEGCKRKVKRILHSVEGVYTIDVDTKQHKVVVTGNVDENTLIRKLEKSGKHAELWPDFYHKNSKKNDEQFHQDQQPQQQQQQQPNQNQNQNQNTNIEKPKVAFRVEEQPQKVAENSGQQSPPQGKEVRFEGNIPATGESQNPPPNAGGNPGGGGGGGGAKKKKKKKKGHGGNNSNNNNNGNGGNGEVASMEHGGNGGQLSSESHSHPPPPPQNPPPQNPNMGPGPGLGPDPNPALDSCPEYMSQPQYPSRNRVYEYPPAYYAAAPVYGVSYNTAYPSSSYSASYYSAPAPYSYAYVHHGGEVEAPGPFDWNTSAVQPSDSFEMFSDENPNACSVM